MRRGCLKRLGRFVDVTDPSSAHLAACEGAVGTGLPTLRQEIVRSFDIKPNLRVRTRRWLARGMTT